MSWKKRLLFAALILGLLGANPGAFASMELAPPTQPLKISGFMQAWLTTGNSLTTAPGINYTYAGDFLRHFRLRFQADPIDGVQVIAVPELAGGFTLLDGYAALNFNQLFLAETVPGEITLTVGQFKTPFGLNRMYVPPQLTSVEYSIISNALFGSKIFWDDGLMATYKGKDFRLDVAAVKGLGPNLFSAPFGLSMNQDYCSRLEVPLFDGQLMVGGSYYYGTHFSTPGTQGFPVPKHWFGGFFKLKGLPKTYEVEAEVISRSNDSLSVNEMFGVNALASFWLLDNVQPFVLYEYVENASKWTLSTGRMGGGFNWYPRTAGPVRITLEMVGESLGSAAGDPTSPSSGKAILQTQVVF